MILAHPTYASAHPCRHPLVFPYLLSFDIDPHSAPASPLFLTLSSKTGEGEEASPSFFAYLPFRQTFKLCPKVPETPLLPSPRPLTSRHSNSTGYESPVTNRRFTCGRHGSLPPHSAASPFPRLSVSATNMASRRNTGSTNASLSAAGSFKCRSISASLS